MKTRLTTYLGLAASALFLTLLPTLGAQAITISPPYYDYHLNPGDTVLDVIKVYNEDPFPLTFHPQLQNFSFKKGEEGGTPLFYPADQNPDGTALAPWITVSSTATITLQPGERANVPFAINVPKENAQPGSHFGAIMLASGAEGAEDGSIGISTKLGSLVFVTVSGDVKEQARIAEFGFKNPKLWYNYLPVDFFLRFEDYGNTHLRPTGNLFIKDWMGRQVAAIKVNPEFSSVLPNSIRRYEFGWKNPVSDPSWSELQKEWHNFAFGKYKATLVLNYGQANQVLSDEREFTVWPWRLLSILCAAVIFILLLVTLLMRVYNKAVIRKYELEKAKKK